MEIINDAQNVPIEMLFSAARVKHQSVIKITRLVSLSLTILTIGQSYTSVEMINSSLQAEKWC